MTNSLPGRLRTGLLSIGIGISLAGALTLATLTAASTAAGTVASPAAGALAGCAPGFVTLPDLPGGTETGGDMTIDEGWVLGHTTLGGEVHNVLWRNGLDPLDLLPSQDLANGDHIVNTPADLGRNVVALNQRETDAAGHTVSLTGVLWRHGVVTPLPAPGPSWRT